MRDFPRVDTRFNDKFVVDRKQLQNNVTRSDNTSWSVAVELDHDPAHRRSYFSPVNDISSSTDLLFYIVKVRFCLTQFLNGFLNCSRTELRDLLICSSYAILCITNAPDQITKITREARFSSLKI